MKELMAHASNFLMAPDLDAPPRVKVRVELIVICSEPAYSYGVEGLKSDRVVTDVRVLCGHAALRETAKTLLILADEAEALEKTMNDATAAAVGAA